MVLGLLTAGHGFAQEALQVTNFEVLPDGRGQFEVHVPDAESYALQYSFDLQDWNFWTVLSGETNYVMQVPVPIVELGTVFVRVASEWEPDYVMELDYTAAWHGELVGGTPAITWPQEIDSWRAELEIGGAAEFLPFADVRFVGPIGSGIDITAEYFNPDDEYGGVYSARGGQRAEGPLPAPGTWSVFYGATELTYQKQDGNDQFVVIVPQFTIEGGLLTAMSWSYRNPVNGADLGAIPEFITELDVRIYGTDLTRCGSEDDLVFEREPGRTETEIVFESPMPWDDNLAVNFVYISAAGDDYNLYFSFGTLYEVYGGNTYPGFPGGAIYCDPQAFGFTLLGQARETATFDGAYDYYLVRAPEHNSVAIDTVRGSNGVHYGTFWTGNVADYRNIGGPPDGLSAEVGDGVYGFRSGGVFLVEVPGIGLSSLTVILAPQRILETPFTRSRLHRVVSRNSIATEYADFQTVGMPALRPISNRAPRFRTIRLRL